MTTIKIAIPYLYGVEYRSHLKPSYWMYVEYISIGFTDEKELIMVALKKTKQEYEYRVFTELLTDELQERLRNMFEYTNKQYTLPYLLKKIVIITKHQLQYHHTWKFPLD